jgi:hypothetical protein
MNTQAFSWTRGRAGRYAATALGALVLALGVLAPVAAQAAAPKTLYVSQGGLDSGSCPSASPCATVSFALTQAASGATIKVSGTINDHDVTIKSPVTITRWPGGPGGSRAVLDGTSSGSAVVDVGGGVTGVTLHALTIQHGGDQGINNFGTLKLTDSTVSGNPLGITNNGNGTMTVIDSTISGNKATLSASAGISNAGAMTVIASTISGNTGATGGTGGIATGAGTIRLGATIVADNTGGNCHAAAAGQIASAGYNLTSDKTRAACSFTATNDRVNKNPLLGHLASNGGPTKTLLPGAGGPADDVIPKTATVSGVPVCTGTDQRGVARPGPSDTRCTIGAVEV